jgi:hypothetical protein
MAVDDIDRAAYIIRHLTERAETAEKQGTSSDVERFVLAHGRRPAYGQRSAPRT